MDIRAWRISCSAGMALRHAFSAGEMQGSKQEERTRVPVFNLSGVLRYNNRNNVEEAGVRITLREPGHPRSLGPKHLNLLNFQSMLGEKLSFQVLKKLGMVVRGGGLNTLDSVANIAKVIK
ncbi:hypothetical protein MRB53_016616 [Persea americana]|uniref:Uncharacterized protein n=1 Tax=Persea americana TaxID=3435 RepID=A0ACC2M2L7_PERAE|nr:hypothetical protein MRB53_016616 [Persea americana]